MWRSIAPFSVPDCPHSSITVQVKSGMSSVPFHPKKVLHSLLKPCCSAGSGSRFHNEIIVLHLLFEPCTCCLPQKATFSFFCFSKWRDKHLDLRLLSSDVSCCFCTQIPLTCFYTVMHVHEVSSSLLHAVHLSSQC